MRKTNKFKILDSPFSIIIKIDNKIVVNAKFPYEIGFIPMFPDCLIEPVSTSILKTEISNAEEQKMKDHHKHLSKFIRSNVLYIVIEGINVDIKIKSKKELVSLI
jgi:hypothetical protein